LGALILAYLASRYTYFAFDITVTRYVQSWNSPELGRVLAFFNQLTNLYPGIAIWAMTVALFLWRGLRIEAFILLLVAISFLAVESLGLLVGRPRPSEDLVYVTQALEGNGFPSGHVFGAMVFYGVLVGIARHYVRWLPLRFLTPALAAAVILLAAFARVYRGAHWPSDVLGGFLLGAVALAGVLWAYSRLKAGHLVFLGLEFHVVERRGRESRAASIRPLSPTSPPRLPIPGRTD
jgi:undecaprenyl-diphosphatase